jgi:hypothetical protein
MREFVKGEREGLVQWWLKPLVARCNIGAWKC